MPERIPFACDRYLTYAELAAELHAIAAAYPHLATVHSAGTSYEGRDILAVTITNEQTGAPEEKPAIYCDGNIHAGEVAPSMILLHAADYLTQRFGRDKEVDHLLNTRTFYLLPRVNPDGAEKYLTTPHLLRSSVRPYPDESVSRMPGLHPVDIDGDGRILTMRVRDDRRGAWKKSHRDPRAMIPRGPDEWEGPFYHLYREGELRNTEGEPFEERPTQWGLDINRNFPSNWHPEIEGGGPYPTSEPEVRAIVEFLVNHPNIGALQAFHTHGGFYYRNPYQYPEEEMDAEDLQATRQIARTGEKVTGYTDEKSDNCCTLTEWAYEHHGILGYTTEVWDRLTRAGVDRMEYRESVDPEAREEMEIKLLRWNDRRVGGRAFHDWREFEHPQLGSVELGGWDPKLSVQNPPEELLHQECYKNTRWIMKHAAALPRLHIEDVQVTQEGADVYRIAARVGNAGYLPTSASNKARSLGVVEPDRVKLQIPDGVEMLYGDSEKEIDYLHGYISGHDPRDTATGESCVQAEWVVRAREGDVLTVRATSDRGGRHSEDVCIANCGDDR